MPLKTRVGEMIIGCSNGVALCILLVSAITLCGCEDLVETRRVEPARSQVSAVRGPWPCGGFWNNLCRGPRFDRHAQAAVKRRYESENGRNHGDLSNCLGVLRFVNCFTTGGCMECDCCSDQFPERRRVPSFRRSERKKTIERRIGAAMQEA
jgi:hypothetical protein